MLIEQDPKISERPSWWGKLPMRPVGECKARGQLVFRGKGNQERLTAEKEALAGGTLPFKRYLWFPHSHRQTEGGQRQQSPWPQGGLGLGRERPGAGRHEGEVEHVRVAEVEDACAVGGGPPVKWWVLVEGRAAPDLEPRRQTNKNSPSQT